MRSRPDDFSPADANQVTLIQAKLRPMRSARLWRSFATASIVAVALAAAAYGADPGAGQASGAVHPGERAVKAVGSAGRDRAVMVTTTACGHASRTSGAGVIVGSGRVITAAHVIIGAGSIGVADAATGTDLGAVTVLRVNPRSDLALLHVSGATGDPIVTADADQGHGVHASGGGPSGSFVATITRRVEVRIEEVRSTTRSRRFGFEIDRRVELGDSGGGVFNDGGELVGIVFGRSSDRVDASFVVRREEIELLLANQDGEDTGWICDPAQNRLVPAQN